MAKNYDYNKGLSTAKFLGVLASVGGALVVKAKGRTWRIVVGSSMLGFGVISGALILHYLHKPRDVDVAERALGKDSRVKIWTYAFEGVEEFIVVKDQKGIIDVKSFDEVDFPNLEEFYIRVVVPSSKHP